MINNFSFNFLKVIKNNWFFNNKFIKPENMNERIMNSNKMYDGKYYLIEFDNQIECGKLINCNHTDYGFSVYFLIGNAYYNSNTLQEQIHQYHIQNGLLLHILPHHLHHHQSYKMAIYLDYLTS